MIVCSSNLPFSLFNSRQILPQLWTWLSVRKRGEAKQNLRTEKSSGNIASALLIYLSLSLSLYIYIYILFLSFAKHATFESLVDWSPFSPIVSLLYGWRYSAPCLVMLSPSLPLKLLSFAFLLSLFFWIALGWVEYMRTNIPLLRHLLVLVIFLLGVSADFAESKNCLSITIHSSWKIVLLMALYITDCSHEETWRWQQPLPWEAVCLCTCLATLLCFSFSHSLNYIYIYIYILSILIWS